MPPARPSSRLHPRPPPPNPAAAPVSPVTAPVNAPANWAGTIDLPGIKLEFTVALQPSSGTISIPMQGAKDMALDGVAAGAESLVFTIKNPGGNAAADAHFDLKLAPDGQTAVGTVKQGGGEFPVKARRLAEGETVAGPVRPQEPKPPFPYHAADVTFENAAAHLTLAGTLTWPTTPGPHPAVVMITGSGAQDRDEALMGHRPFLVIADHLARHGIAVLRFDDRGFGKSTGSFMAATSDDFATDALAAVAYLKTRPEINPHSIGLVGHSEGGLIAPICASQSPDVAFVVLLAGTGVPGSEILPLQAKLISMAAGMSLEDADKQNAVMNEVFKLVNDGAADDVVLARIKDAVVTEIKSAPAAAAMSEQDISARADQLAKDQFSQLSSKWFRRFLSLDPRQYLSKVKVPVLALNGSKDLQVPADQNLPEIRTALKAAGNTDVTITELPGLNHLFQHTQTGSPSEYATIEETFAPEALEAMSTWIRQRTGLDHPAATGATAAPAK